MNTQIAQTAGRMAPAAGARLRAVSVQLGGTGLGMYPCAWYVGSNPVDAISTAIFADTTSHKAWRPKEPSP